LSDPSLRGSICNFRPKSFGPLLNAKPKSFGSEHQIQELRVQTPAPRALGQVGLQDPRDLGLHPSHTQETWVGCPFPAPSYLGLEGDVKSKLIIITTIIYFILEIKSIFFLIVIIFISNLIILMSLIIFIILIIISNLFDPSFDSF
jgi:hypothetical protein